MRPTRVAERSMALDIGLMTGHQVDHTRSMCTPASVTASPDLYRDRSACKAPVAAEAYEVVEGCGRGAPHIAGT
jgi:hypothetical protein